MKDLTDIIQAHEDLLEDLRHLINGTLPPRRTPTMRYM